MILITGDKGFVGRHLTKLFEDYVGYDLVDGFDIRDAYQLDTVFENHQIDTVIHMAALAGVRKSILFPDDYIDTNIRGTMNVVESCKRHGVKHLIFLSSSSVYGNGQPPNTETAPTEPIAPYGITKLAGELLVKSSGVPYTIVRPFSLYGEGGRRDQIVYKWINQIKQGLPITLFGDGSARRGFTYVGDFIQGIIAILKNGPQNEVYNIGSQDIVTIKEILDIIQKEVPFVIDQRPAPKEDIFENWADNTKITTLGWQPKTQFRDKLKEIIKTEL